MPLNLAIVGSGFSGVALAWQLLGRLPAGSQITMVNGSGRFARGVAYGTRSADHLLNVPAARMSLDPDQPRHFVDWLRCQETRWQALDGHEFVPRRCYGDYLEASLSERIRSRAPVRLHQRVGTVSACLPQPGGGWQLCFSDSGPPTHFDAVVLALGHFAPRPPHPALASLGRPGYVPDPWAESVWDDLPTLAGVALIGSGLTMLDALISLRARGHQGPLLALSRRGLMAQSHRSNELPPHPWVLDPALLPAQPLRLRLRRFRIELARARQAGVDWRDVWAAFRPHTAAAWESLGPIERSRFLRHLLPYWDVHRHRAAPGARAMLDEPLASGQLQQVAGRIESVTPTSDGLRLTWRARGSQHTKAFMAARVVNCSGPSSAIDAQSSPLLWSLLQAGRLQACPHGLGLLVDEAYRIRDANGQGQAGLHYLGPHLRAQRWEATAVPELREHAAALAATLADQATRLSR